MFFLRQLGEQEVLKNQNISKLESSGSMTKQLEQENETYRYVLITLYAPNFKEVGEVFCIVFGLFIRLAIHLDIPLSLPPSICHAFLVSKIS